MMLSLIFILFQANFQILCSLSLFLEYNIAHIALEDLKNYSMSVCYFKELHTAQLKYIPGVVRENPQGGGVFIHLFQMRLAEIKTPPKSTKTSIFLNQNETQAS